MTALNSLHQVFRLQLPPVTAASPHCYQERVGSPKVHTMFKTVLNLLASSLLSSLNQGCKWGWLVQHLHAVDLLSARFGFLGYRRVPLPPSLEEGRAVPWCCVPHTGCAALSASALPWKMRAGDMGLALIPKNLNSGKCI